MNTKETDGLVSIIMPSYNTGDFIAEVIQSVINQAYHNWEFIIVDNCSDDDTMDVIQGFMDEQIRLFRARENCGAAVCRNKALREFNGRLIAFPDSDDLWHPDKLSKQIAFMISVTRGVIVWAG